MVYIICIVRFIKWFRSAYFNIEAAGLNIDKSESTAAWSWFVPIYNLFAPYQIMKEVWLKNVYDQFGVKVEDGDLVIDIGAHIGIFSTYAAEKNKSGKIFSFEPFHDNFKRLKFHKNLNNKSNIKILILGIAYKKNLDEEL